MNTPTVGSSGDFLSGLVGSLGSLAQTGVQTYNAVTGNGSTSTGTAKPAATATGTGTGTLGGLLGKNSIWILGGAAMLVVVIIGFVFLRKK